MKCVYLRTNKINGKQYVGQTVNLKSREYDWKCLKGKYSNPYLNNARKKYGVENFSLLILKECNTQQERERISKSLINNPKKSKKVYCYENGILKAIYPSISEAARQTNSSVSHICSCCKGERNTHNGYTWSFNLIA